MRTRTFLALLLATSIAAGAASAVDLRGKVTLDGGSKDSGAAHGALVYYQPDSASGAPLAVPDEPFRIVTVRKEFTPRSLVVPVGATVRFPNQDNILHNVFSLSGSNRFDLGLYRRGEGKEVTFEAPGVVRVFCNVHHSMVAYVVVVETPYYSTVSVDGGFTLDGLPAGSGRLVVWHERAEPREIEVDLPYASPLDVRLEITKPRVPRHQNKFGKPYSRRRGRDYG